MNNKIKIKPAVKYCPRCGRELPIEADVCICGEEQPDFTIRRMESRINSLSKEKRSLKKHQSTSRIVARMMLIMILVVILVLGGMSYALYSILPADGRHSLIAKMDPRSVEFTVPKKVAGYMDSDDSTIKIEGLSNDDSDGPDFGIRSMDKQGNGDVIVKISKSGRQYLLDYCKKQLNDSINDSMNSGAIPSVKSVDIGNDMTNVTMTVNSDDYQMDIGASLLPIEIVLYCGLYQMVDGVNDSNVAVHFKTVDENNKTIDSFDMNGMTKIVEAIESMGSDTDS